MHFAVRVRTPHSAFASAWPCRFPGMESKIGLDSQPSSEGAMRGSGCCVPASGNPAEFDVHSGGYQVGCLEREQKKNPRGRSLDNHSKLLIIRLAYAADKA